MKRIDFTTSYTDGDELPSLWLGENRAGIIDILKTLTEAVNELIDRENRRWEQESDTAATGEEEGK